MFSRDRKRYSVNKAVFLGEQVVGWMPERIELYLLDCGITREEIEKFRSIMLEPKAGK